MATLQAVVYIDSHHSMCFVELARSPCVGLTESIANGGFTGTSNKTVNGRVSLNLTFFTVAFFVAGADGRRGRCADDTQIAGWACRHHTRGGRGRSVWVSRPPAGLPGSHWGSISDFYGPAV